MPEIRLRERTQIMMCSFDSFVDDDSIARVIDAFVEKLNLTELKFTKTNPKHTGRPLFPAKSMLKLYLYGNCKGIRSSRKLAEACHINLEVKWLMSGLEPDFRTISNFRKNNIKCMKDVFHEFNRMIASGLSKGFISVDGSKIRACNSKENNFTASKLDDRIHWLNAKTEEYMRLLEEADAEDDEISGNLTREQLEKKLADARERLTRYEGYRQYMEDNGLSQLSLTDRDAKLMKSRNGFEVAYNLQTAVDSETHLIEDFQVTDQPTDHALIASTVEDEKNRRNTVTEAVADAGYVNEDDMAACLTKGIIPHVISDKGGNEGYSLKVPYAQAEITADMIKSTDTEDIRRCLSSGIVPDVYKPYISKVEIKEHRVYEKCSSKPKSTPYASEEEMRNRAMQGYFVRDPERNLVICPAGVILRQKSIKKNGFIRYANKTGCRHCKYRNICYQGKQDFKEIDFSKDCLEKPNRFWIKNKGGPAPKNATRSAGVHYTIKKIVHFLFKPDKQKMEKRKCTSEHPFGTIKWYRNAGHFLLKGKIKVQGETALSLTGYNIPHAIKLLGFSKIMEIMS